MSQRVPLLFWIKNWVVEVYRLNWGSRYKLSHPNCHCNIRITLKPVEKYVLVPATLHRKWFSCKSTLSPTLIFMMVSIISDISEDTENIICSIVSIRSLIIFHLQTFEFNFKGLDSRNAQMRHSDIISLTHPKLANIKATRGLHMRSKGLWLGKLNSWSVQTIWDSSNLKNNVPKMAAKNSSI